MQGCEHEYEHDTLGERPGPTPPPRLFPPAVPFLSPPPACLTSPRPPFLPPGPVAEASPVSPPPGPGSAPRAPLARPPRGGGAPRPDGVTKTDGFELDEKRQRLTRHDAGVELSYTEFRILHAFMTRPGEVLSREKVLSLVFGDDHYVCDRNIDVYISRIRAILRKLGEEGTRIRTVWGAGYSWVTEE